MKPLYALQAAQLPVADPARLHESAPCGPDVPQGLSPVVLAGRDRPRERVSLRWRPGRVRSREPPPTRAAARTAA